MSDSDEAVKEAVGEAKDNMRYEINRMKHVDIDGTIWVKREEVEEIIEDI